MFMVFNFNSTPAMDRVAAMLMLLGALVSLVLILLALFAMAPIVCSCLLSLLYTLYLFMAYEESEIHHAQEYENRFWTMFALLFSTALFFAQDSPLAFGQYSPTLGFFAVILSSYGMHLWDRYMHRIALSRQTKLRRSVSLNQSIGDMKVTVEEQVEKINEALQDIDQLLIPSTINNFINQRFIFKKEKTIIEVFLDCDAVALNYIISHVKLGLLIYKIKDHRNFAGQHRTELIQLLAVDRLPALTVMSRVIVLHALQILKLRAHPRAEDWVRNIILSTHGDDLSEIKTLTDAKGDYFCMNKLIFDDIKSETVRQDILTHIRKEGAMQISHMQLGTKRAKRRQHMAWRKILSDVDDTLFCSGGSYPAGIDKRFSKKVVYPGVLAFYRELDLGTRGPEEWPEHRVGNLVFLSARPHVYKDMSEKSNFKKFEKLRMRNEDGRTGMHTVPSLLAGDIASGSQYIATNDFEPLSKKKFDNFRRYVSIYPEFQHVFVCDNGQGDVRAAEMMFDRFPYEFEALYVHVVQDISKTHGYALEQWQKKEFYPHFFRTYPEAAYKAATHNPPQIRVTGLQRVCSEAVKDFHSISSKQWLSQKQKADRRSELNQAIWRANQFLIKNGIEQVKLIQAERLWKDDEKVSTPYGNGTVKGFDAECDLYTIELDWRPLDVQVDEHLLQVKEAAIRPKPTGTGLEKRSSLPLETVVEMEEGSDDEMDDAKQSSRRYSRKEKGAGTAVVSASSSADESLNGDSNDPDHNTNPLPASPTSAKLERSVSAPAKFDESVDSSSSLDSSGSMDSSQDEEVPLNSQDAMRVVAKISGVHISKYVPPNLPRISTKPTSIFSFWIGSFADGKVSKSNFAEGDKCTTPYGIGTIVEHRMEQKIVVIDMVGWTARGYLREELVKVSKESLLSSLFRSRQSSSLPDPSMKQQQGDTNLSQGTIINTPFGVGEVIRPVPTMTTTTTTIQSSNNNNNNSNSSKKENKSNRVDQHHNGQYHQTMCLDLKDFKLADGSYAKLYCIPKTAQIWKETRGQGSKGLLSSSSTNDGLFSAFGTLVSSTLDFAGSFVGTQKGKEDEDNDDDIHQILPKYKKYYQISAAVSTAFGNGVVLDFRENDGFYLISLSNWVLGDGTRNATAWLREVDISYQIVKGCQEGYPILTNFGYLTGTLESVQPTTGVHIVTVPLAGMIMYLQPSAIIRPLKAAVGEDALTAYGEGTVESYDMKTDTYKIKLTGWNGSLYAKAETFDRVRDSMRDKDGPFGMNWLLRFFFSSATSTTAGGGDNNGITRSRSNSIVSGSLLSQSARSLSQG